MALGETVEVQADPRKISDAVSPTSLTSTWETIIDPGGMIIQDAASIQDPSADISSSTRHIFQRKGKGTLLLLRMAYPASLGTITDPIVKVFGRANANEEWQLLQTRAGSNTVTIETDTANDTNNGVTAYTIPNYSAQCVDCLGCDQLLVGVQTILAAGSGTPDSASLEGKFI